MADTITKEDVLHVAQLARLEIDESEVDMFTHQLNDILTYVAHISTLDTAQVEPTAHILPQQNVSRPDGEPHGSLGSDKVVKLSAEQNGSFIVVPPVIE